jgi:hypothetical protein
MNPITPAYEEEGMRPGNDYILILQDVKSYGRDAPLYRENQR